jgi:hypothetical protein
LHFAPKTSYFVWKLTKNLKNENKLMCESLFCNKSEQIRLVLMEKYNLIHHNS